MSKKSWDRYILSPKLTRIKYRIESFFEKNQVFPDGQDGLGCIIIQMAYICVSGDSKLIRKLQVDV